MASAAAALSRASTFANNELCRVLNLVADAGHGTILVEALLTKADGAWRSLLGPWCQGLMANFSSPVVQPTAAGRASAHYYR